MKHSHLISGHLYQIYHGITAALVTPIFLPVFLYERGSWLAIERAWQKFILITSHFGFVILLWGYFYINFLPSRFNQSKLMFFISYPTWSLPLPLSRSGLLKALQGIWNVFLPAYPQSRRCWQRLSIHRPADNYARYSFQLMPRGKHFVNVRRNCIGQKRTRDLKNSSKQLQ